MIVPAFNSNLHPAESLAEIREGVVPLASAVRERLGWRQIGLDLRLGSRAMADCAADPAAAHRLRDAFDAAGVVVVSINAFPLRAFQAPVVKDGAYRPDWTEAERLRDSIACIEPAAVLCPEGPVTISTVPGSYKPWGAAANDPARIAAGFGRWVAAAARHRQATGRQVVLCPEPEPWCSLEQSHEVASFWSGPLMRAGVAAAAADLDGDEAAARTALREHLGLCVDTCHTSLAFEDQSAAVQRCADAGAQAWKCQFSAAPLLRESHRDTAGLQALRELAEPRFLHQTAARTAAGSLAKVPDLDALDRLLARLPDAVEVRSHFHVPVFWPEQEQGLSTTIAESVQGLRACLSAGCTHVAVETYTWSVLAADERDVIAGTARELDLLQRLLTETARI
ncbi:MAG: metabolite traffic protein EboE [Planctomycetota bacterium]